MTTINVELPDDVYNGLKSMMLAAKCKTWVSFFQKIISQEIDAYFEILSIKHDEENPEIHIVEFKLGDYVYRYDGNINDIVLVSSPHMQQVKVALFRKLG